MNPPKLLLDENLSPSIALTLTREGYDVVHIRDRGLLQATDAQVFARAFAEDRIVVTFNCDDFKKVGQAATVHAGLVFFEDSGLLRDEQLDLVRKALGHIADELTAGRDMINRVLRIWSDSAHVTEWGIRWGIAATVLGISPDAKVSSQTAQGQFAGRRG